MTLRDMLEEAEHATRPRPSHPKGWEPGCEWNGRTGWIIGEPSERSTSPAFDALLAEFGFDPQIHEIVGPIQVRRWQQRPGEDYLYYHRATVSLRPEGAPDVAELVAQVKKRKPRTPPTGNGSAGLVVCWADWQVGKGDGDGVEGTAERLGAMVGAVEARWRALVKLGVPLDTLYVCGMGDLREACGGHYPQQQFRVQLNERDQRELIRGAIDVALERWSKLAPKVAVRAVGGNHGEVRQQGKSFTDFADNVDVAVFADVAFAYSKNPDRYGNVSFHLPQSDLTATFDHGGVIVGLAHGHQAKGGGDAKGRLYNWWKGQMDGRQPIGDADILVTAHYHHPWMIRGGHRTHFGCPALEGDSEWWRQQAGVKAPPGTLTFVVDGTDARGWHSMEIV